MELADGHPKLAVQWTKEVGSAASNVYGLGIQSEFREGG